MQYDSLFSEIAVDHVKSEVDNANMFQAMAMFYKLLENIALIHLDFKISRHLEIW